ncbi:MAG TPA: FAD-dependent oxidoreductase [Alicycliphilus sp.]|nr:FAD-dependent oxidoreductase [Alicycliphilus sp.]
MSHFSTPTQDTAFDVLVIGSGASGLTTALVAHELGLKVLVVEKAPLFGGTTSRSGGWVWAPGNPLARRYGVQDPLEQARIYIQHEAGEHFDAARVDAFLAASGPMVEFMEKHTQVRFNFGENYPDYHPDAPGGAAQGRSIHPQPYDGVQLGPWLKRLAKPMKESTFMGMGLNSGPDLKHFLNATRSVGSAAFVGKRILSHFYSVLRHGEGTRLVNGCALAARLLASAVDKGIELWSSAEAVALPKVGGRVIGATIRIHDKTVQVSARCAVVLAAGGFPRDEKRRRRHFSHLRNQTVHATLAPEYNTGDGLRLAEGAGGVVDGSLPNAGPWAPVSLVQYPDGSEGRFFHLIDRAKPGVIAVDGVGRRFVNESQNYHDFVEAMIRATPADKPVCAYMVCDHRALRRYGMGAVRPYPLPIGSFLRSGYLVRGSTIEELAVRLGLDPKVLGETVSTFNTDAHQGRDSQFGKGTTAYQRLLGDTDFQPNPCLGPLERGPFYAVRVVPGDLGTYHGLHTNAATQVLDHGGTVIEGLYAVGNDATSIFGGSYPGAGATLGPAMTFGFICARHIVAVDKAT